MCTLSWRRHDQALEILFNRDESLARPEAEPPSEEVISGTRVLAPRDPTGGGTWLWTNEYGLTLCLLNNYQAQNNEPVNGQRSRGLLALDLAPLASMAQLEQHLHATDCSLYQPFYLIVFSPRQSPAGWCWDGRSLKATSTPNNPVSTSSLYPRLVPRLRQFYYRTATINGLRTLTTEQHLRLHRSRKPWPPAFAIAMSRPDRGTVSLTRVRISDAEARMDYWPGDPSQNQCEVHTQHLPLSSGFY